MKKCFILWIQFCLFCVLACQMAFAQTEIELPTIESLKGASAKTTTIEDETLNYETEIVINPDNLTCAIEEFEYRSSKLLFTTIRLDLSSSPLSGVEYEYSSFSGTLQNVSNCDEGMEYFSQLIETNNGRVTVRVKATYKKDLYSYKSNGSLKHQYKIRGEFWLFFPNEQSIRGHQYEVIDL